MKIEKRKLKINQPAHFLFIAAFTVAFTLQLSLWSFVEFSDHTQWVERTSNLIHDLSEYPPTFPIESATGPRYGGHPGTAVISLAAILNRTGLTLTRSLSVSVALINALLIAALTVTAQRLRPHLPWWPAVLVIATLNPLYFYATPTNAVIGPLIALIVLQTLYLYETKPHRSKIFSLTRGTEGVSSDNTPLPAQRSLGEVGPRPAPRPSEVSREGGKPLGEVRTRLWLRRPGKEKHEASAYNLQLTTYQLPFLGTLIGLGLATRYPITAFISLPLLVFLEPKLGRRAIFTIIIIALVVGVLLNPPFVFSPLEYSRRILLSTTSHVVYNDGSNTTTSLATFLLFAPHALLSFLAYLIVTALPRPNLLPLPRKFIMALLLITAAASTIFLTARYQTLRYFYPLIFIWDSLLPLLILHLANQVHFPFARTPATQHHLRYLTLIILATLISAAYVIHLGYNLFTPSPRGII